MKHVRTKGWHVLSSRLTKFPRMNPDARWQQRRIPQCPHGRNPDHRGNYSSWTCSLETAEYFSNKFDDVSMNMFPFRFLGTGGENEFLFLNCAMCKDCHLLLCCWMPRIFLVPREIWKDSLCDTVALFGTPCPPQELGRSHLELKNKRHWKTRPQHYRHINSSWKWVETIQATVCMQRFEKKTCFVSIIHGFSSKQKSFMSIYRWQCFQHISGKKNSNKCIDMDI